MNARTDAGRLAVLAVVKFGGSGAWVDICALQLSDGEPFAGTDWAHWTSAAPGVEFSGHGVSKEHDRGVPIFGKVVAIGDGGETLIVTAENLDTRIEPGCSGAAAFALPDDPVIGMVATYQQEQTGTLIAARTIAEFWPSFQKSAPPVSLGFPSLTGVQPTTAPDLPRLDGMIGEIDRGEQKRDLINAISGRDLFRSPGLVISTFTGNERDLPHVCADFLSQLAFRRLLARIAPDATKTVRPIRARLCDLLDDSDDLAALNLRSAIGEKLGVAGASMSELKRVVASTLVPLPIVVEARPRDLSRTRASTIAAWAKVIDQLARPGKHQPIAMFIIVIVPDDTTPDSASIPAPQGHAPYFVALKPLPPIRPDDIDFWAFERFGDEPEGRRTRRRINAMVAERSGGRQEFRLGDVQEWLCEGAGG